MANQKQGQARAAQGAIPVPRTSHDIGLSGRPAATREPERLAPRRKAASCRALVSLLSLTRQPARPSSSPPPLGVTALCGRRRDGREQCARARSRMVQPKTLHSRRHLSHGGCAGGDWSRKTLRGGSNPPGSSPFQAVHPASPPLNAKGERRPGGRVHGGFHAARGRGEPGGTTPGRRPSRLGFLTRWCESSRRHHSPRRNRPGGSRTSLPK